MKVKDIKWNIIRKKIYFNSAVESNVIMKDFVESHNNLLRIRIFLSSTKCATQKYLHFTLVLHLRGVEPNDIFYGKFQSGEN